jgi:tRNA A-37 threonylcarbamoyl transferase component Bud32
MFPAIKNYTIIREVGSGGMATVYEAVDTRLQRTVALKVLHAHLCREPSASDRFIREAKAAAKMDHPGVVRIFDFGSIDTMLYIVMEYVPGTNLERVLRVRGAVRPAVAVEIMRGIAEALSQAHALGIIHRDVKPANMLLHKQGRVMLSAFGLARHLPDPRLTTDDAVAGTPSFMSPEQIGGKAVSAATDVYSWGVCFYMLLTGKLPYETQKYPEIIEEIRRGAITLDPVLMGSLEPQYHDLLSRSLAADPANRIRDGSELLLQMDQLKKDRSTGVDLKSLCGDIPEEYDAPKTARSGTAVMPRAGKSRAPAAVVLIVTAIAAVFGVGALFFGRLSGGSALTSHPPATKAEPRPRMRHDTTLAGQAREVISRMEREGSYGRAQSRARLAIKAPNSTARALTPPKSLNPAPQPPMDDTSRALLDSFNMISPEPSGKNEFDLTRVAHAFQEKQPIPDKAVSGSDSGRLFVYCEPWATVYADDREIGTTPFKGPVSLPAGVHVIRLVNNYYRPLVDTLTLPADSVLRKRYTLEVKQ